MKWPQLTDLLRREMASAIAASSLARVASLGAVELK
jgi:hypothetical protein